MPLPAAILVGLALLVSPVIRAQSADRPFGRDEAEHLLNRIGFGGTPEEIAAATARGREATVDYLLDRALEETAAAAPFPVKDVRTEARKAVRAEGRKLDPAERRKLTAAARQKDGEQLLRYRDDWIERMISSESPAVEKLTLFFAGHFTSSQRDVKNSAHMIAQAETLRRNALGSFRTMLHEIARDPAMLAYLDNDDNKKQAPNENFAREVMELFTLGVGNYTEADVKEAARAFTGWRAEGDRFVLNARQHDFGTKTVLGRTGRFDGDDVLDILLAEEAAPRFVASRILSFFVAPDPSPALIAKYAALLRANDWSLRPVFRSLFLDPAFYADDVMFGRILGPVEFGVAMARKFPGRKPPGRLVAAAADLLGQSLFAPPNVKGWEGGESWMTTSAMLLRGNLALAMVDGADAIKTDLFRRSSGELQGGYGREPLAWKPDFEVGGLLETAAVVTPEQAVDVLCDRFLSAPVSAEARAELVSYVKASCIDGRFVVRGPVSERAHRRLLHLILSLPEAQLG